MTTQFLDVSATTPRVGYTVGGTPQSAFTVPFVFFADTDLVVYVAEVQKTLNTHYTVTGAGSQTGGTVTFLAPQSNVAIMIVRTVPISLTTHIPTSGQLDVAGLNIQNSRFTAMLQQVNDKITRTIRLPDTEATVDAVLPPLSTRASKFAVFDSAGTLTAAATLSGSVIVSGAMTPVIQAASINAALGLLGLINPTFTTVAVNGTAVLPINPTGNTGYLTMAGLTVQSTTVQPVQREFLVNFGLTSNLGSAAVGNLKDKVTLYSGIVGQSGSGDIWALNTVTIMNAASGSYNALGYELDFNNDNGHRGDLDGGSGFAAPVAYGLAVTGAGAFRSTAAILVAGPGTKIWNRGLAFGNDSISQASIQDLGTATVSIDIRGTHLYGVDLKPAIFTGAPIRIPNNSAIMGRNGADNADVNMVKITTADNILLGKSTGKVKVAGTAEPIFTFDVEAAANERFCVGAHTNLADGTCVRSINDANNAVKGLEFIGSTIFLDYTVALQLAGVGFAAGAKAQARYLPVTIGIGGPTVNILCD